MSTLERELGFDDQVWRQRLGSATAATFLAWHDGEPAGTATGKTEDPDDEFAVPGAWQLVGMWVDPRARGHGRRRRPDRGGRRSRQRSGRAGPRALGDGGQRPRARLLPADGILADRCPPAGQADASPTTGKSR